MVGEKGAKAGGGVMRDYPAKLFQAAVGKRIVAVTQGLQGDEGLALVLDDGSILRIVFSGGEGEIELSEATQHENPK
jgi:hypothetical protein